MAGSPRGILGRVLAASAVAALAAATGIRLATVGLTAGPGASDIEAACATDNPYLVTATYEGRAGTGLSGAYDPRAAAVVMFRDTPANRPQYRMATFDQIGAVWGLAYSGAEHAVYAASYHKVQLPFGPGGPGAIYRIDLGTGAVDLAITVPDAGEDHHESPIVYDRDAGWWTGRTSLGDIEIASDGSELYAVNLADRKIYSFELPSGRLISSFHNGAFGEPWAESARPFGLGWRAGYVYHGVVNSAEVSLERDELSAHVYRSRPDGSDMSEVAAFALDYKRGRVSPFTRRVAYPLDWQAWREGKTLPYSGGVEGDGTLATYPMPMLSDIDFDAAGRMVLGFRDRRSDAWRYFDREAGRAGPIPNRYQLAFGVGDLLLGVRTSDGWSVDTSSEFFSDNLDSFGDECAMGGVAEVAGGTRTVSGAFIRDGGYGGNGTVTGALWFDNESGGKAQQEFVWDPRGFEPFRSLVAGVPRVAADDELVYPARAPSTVGDIEVLCIVEEPPTPTPTATTIRTATGTATATATQLASTTPTTRFPTGTPSPTPSPSPSPTPTRGPQRAYLPLVLAEHCSPGTVRMDAALVIDASTSMRDDRTSAGRTKLEAAIEAASAFLAMLSLPNDQAAVVAFNSDAWTEQELTGRRPDLDQALWRVAGRVRQQTRIDRGIEVAHEELTSSRRRPLNRPVMIVLTDGLANPEPASTAVRRAQAAKDDGITIFTVGLGRDAELNVVELAQMASRLEYFYRAPDGEDLLEIYRSIAVEIPCPADQYWGRR